MAAVVTQLCKWKNKQSVCYGINATVITTWQILVLLSASCFHPMTLDLTATEDMTAFDKPPPPPKKMI